MSFLHTLQLHLTPNKSCVKCTWFPYLAAASAANTGSIAGGVAGALIGAILIAIIFVIVVIVVVRVRRSERHTFKGKCIDIKIPSISCWKKMKALFGY